MMTPAECDNLTKLLREANQRANEFSREAVEAKKLAKDYSEHVRQLRDHLAQALAAIATREAG